MNEYLELLKNNDCKILSYISDKLYDGYNLNEIKNSLDNKYNTRFTSNDVTLEENQWLLYTCNDAEKINRYQLEN